MKRLYGLSFTVFLFGVLIYAIIEWYSKDSGLIDVTPDEAKPEFVAESLKSDVFDVDGKLTYVINADRMEHFEQKAITEFSSPRYTLYPKNEQSPWNMRANQGTLHSDNKVVLQDRVRLVATDAESFIQEVHGTYLELDLNTNVISSEQTIMIKGSGFTIYGSGLTVDLDSRQMTLKEHVQTIYQNTNS